MKDYIDARDVATRSQNDARFSEVLAGIEKVNSNLSAFGEIVRSRFDTIDGDVKAAKAAAEHAESAAKAIKWNILATGIAVLGVFLAAWTIWAQGMELTTALIGAKGQ